MASTTSDPTNEILLDYKSIFHVYKDGSIVRFAGTEFAPPGTDPATNVTTADVTIDPVKNITARLHVPNVVTDSSSGEIKRLPVLVYFHGGAFCYASAFLPQFQPYLNTVASRAQVLIVSVNYRLATEHLLPAAYEDSMDAIKWVRSSGSDELLVKYGDVDRLFLGGESAGANIVHHMALQAAENNLKIQGAIIIHPFFWGSTPIGSETTDIKMRGFIELLWKVINRPGVDIDHPWVNPVSKDAPKLSGFGCKRVLVCVAENDALVERGRMYVKALKESGWTGDVELFESKGVDHAFYLKEAFGTERCMELIDKIVAFLKL